jgi:uncharacterized protein
LLPIYGTWFGSAKQAIAVAFTITLFKEGKPGDIVTKAEIIPGDIRFDGLSLITGFHGIGATGYGTVKYLLQQLKPERVAFLDTDALTPIATTSGGRIATPFEIYRHEDLAILKAEVSPSRGSEISFLRDVCRIIIATGFKELALIGGLDISLKGDDGAFRYVKTTNFEPRGLLKDSKILEDDRIIVGPVALMLSYMEIRNFPAFAILPYASPSRVDPRASADALKIISKLYGIDIDIDPLIRGAEEIESQTAIEETRTRGGTDSIYT